jgi:hypothetical protein
MNYLRYGIASVLAIATASHMAGAGAVRFCVVLFMTGCLYAWVLSFVLKDEEPADE